AARADRPAAVAVADGLGAGLTVDDERPVDAAEQRRLEDDVAAVVLERVPVADARERIDHDAAYGRDALLDEELIVDEETGVDVEVGVVPVAVPQDVTVVGDVHGARAEARERERRERGQGVALLDELRAVADDDE